MKYYVKVKDGGIWFETYEPIQRTKEQLEEYKKALDYLAKTQSDLIFDTQDYTRGSDIAYAGNPSEIYEYFEVDDWDEFQKLVADKVRVPNEHITLEYCCKDAEKGDDGCTAYFTERCRRCRCEQGIFIKPGIKYKTQKKIDSMEDILRDVQTYFSPTIDGRNEIKQEEILKRIDKILKR